MGAACQGRCNRNRGPQKLIKPKKVFPTREKFAAMLFFTIENFWFYLCFMKVTFQTQNVLFSEPFFGAILRGGITRPYCLLRLLSREK